MRYIGITGKRGVGRDKFGWLLGSVLEDLTHEKQGRIVDNAAWCDKVCYIRHQAEPVSSSHTCITSFASQIEDQAMLLCGSTFGLEWKKNPGRYFVLMDTMEVVEEVSEGYTIVNHNTYSTVTNKPAMAIEEFIIYYGETIKRAYGADIWTKVASSWMKNKLEDVNDPTTTIIFTDVKTNAEAEYILSKNGYLIEVVCPEREQQGSYTDLLSDSFKQKGQMETFILEENFEEDEEDIKTLAKRIYKHFELNKKL